MKTKSRKPGKGIRQRRGANKHSAFWVVLKHRPHRHAPLYSVAASVDIGPHSEVYLCPEPWSGWQGLCPDYDTAVSRAGYRLEPALIVGRRVARIEDSGHYVLRPLFAEVGPCWIT